MINSNIFNINRRIYIMLADSPETYTSRIEDIGSSSMTIAMPMSQGTPVFLSNGETFIGKIIIDTSVYKFTSKLIDKQISPLPVWNISFPQDIKKIQQRFYVRLNIMLPIEFGVIDKEKGETDDLPVEKIFTKDISGGGLLLIHKKPIPIGTRLRLRLLLPECDASETIDSVAEVVRVNEQDSTPNTNYLVGVKFLDLQEKVRSKIIRFIFKKQVERKKREI